MITTLHTYGANIYMNNVTFKKNKVHASVVDYTDYTYYQNLLG